MDDPYRCVRMFLILDEILLVDIHDPSISIFTYSTDIYKSDASKDCRYPWIPRNGTGLVSEPHNCRVPLCWLSYLSSSFKNNISSLNGITSNNESICSLHICQFPCRVFTCLPSFFSRVCLDISSPGDSVLDWFLGHTLSWWIIIIIIAINHYHDYDLCFELCILTIFFYKWKKIYIYIYIYIL